MSNIFIIIVLVFSLLEICLTNNLRILQLEPALTIIDNEVLTKENFKNFLNPEIEFYRPIAMPKNTLNKPSYVIDSTKEVTKVMISNKVTLADYEYSGVGGLGSGVIAIITFIIVGALICIIGLATEYQV